MEARMGWLLDLLKEVPLSAVLQERIRSAEDRFSSVIKENERLKLQITALEAENSELQKTSAGSGTKTPQRVGDPLTNDAKKALVHLFRANGVDDRGDRTMARALGVEIGVMKYYLDLLDDAGLAVLGSHYEGENYWGLTAAGRKYVVENNLV
jgi:hypothetical protein